MFTQIEFELSRTATNVLPDASWAADGSPAKTPPELDTIVLPNVDSRMFPAESRKTAVGVFAPGVPD